MRRRRTPSRRRATQPMPMPMWTSSPTNRPRLHPATASPRTRARSRGAWPATSGLTSARCTVRAGRAGSRRRTCRRRPTAVRPVPRRTSTAATRSGEVQRVALTKIQRFAATNLQQAWQTVPHVTHHEDADITDLEAFRKQLNAEQSDVKVTMVALLLKACAATLAEFPRFASSLDGEEIVIKPDLHLGFAADTPNGLVVPVVRDVPHKGILELAGELTDLSGKARAGKLSPKEMSGAVFTISSLGGIGGTGFTPIVNPPQVAILGVVRSAMKPVWDGSAFVPRLMLPAVALLRPPRHRRGGGRTVLRPPRQDAGRPPPRAALGDGRGDEDGPSARGAGRPSPRCRARARWRPVGLVSRRRRRRPRGRRAAATRLRQARPDEPGAATSGGWHPAGVGARHACPVDPFGHDRVGRLGAGRRATADMADQELTRAEQRRGRVERRVRPGRSVVGDERRPVVTRRRRPSPDGDTISVGRERGARQRPRRSPARRSRRASLERRARSARRQIRPRPAGSGPTRRRSWRCARCPPPAAERASAAPRSAIASEADCVSCSSVELTHPRGNPADMDDRRVGTAEGGHRPRGSPPLASAESSNPTVLSRWVQPTRRPRCPPRAGGYESVATLDAVQRGREDDAVGGREPVEIERLARDDGKAARLTPGEPAVVERRADEASALDDEDPGTRPPPAPRRRARRAAAPRRRLRVPADRPPA